MNHNVRDNHDDVRYVLTEQGMQFLAARAGVPPSTFGEHGAVTYVKGADRDHPERAVKHVAHTLGLNRFMVGLARDARARGWRLGEWRNEAESTCRFVDEAGQATVRPDASGSIVAGGERIPFLVEYDRGTLDAGDFRRKFEGYRRYYASEAWRAMFDREPVLLFVCTDDRAAERVSRAAVPDERGIPLLMTTEARSARHASNPDGCVGVVWRRQMPGGQPLRWPSVPESQTDARGDRDAT